MKICFILFFFIFFVNCSFNDNRANPTRYNNQLNEINFSKVYSFEEYVNLLLKINNPSKIQDINNFPD